MRRVNGPMNDLAFRYLHPHDDDRILEVGFAHGALLERLLARPTHGYVAGAEISGTMLDAAMARYRRELATGRLDLRLGSIMALPFDDARFDAVVSVNTVYFWPDLDTGLRELARVLEPGGRLVLVQRAHSRDSLRYTVRTEEGELPVDSLVARVEQAGFRVRHRLLRKVPFQMALVIAAEKQPADAEQVGPSMLRRRTYASSLPN
jgi:SAM-dependent methyltransferase